MRTKLVLLSFLATVLVPTSAFALEGIGRRVNVVGVVKSTQFTTVQKADGNGGILQALAANGQMVTVTMDPYTKVMREGSSSRRELKTTDIANNMQIRFTGVRKGTAEVAASLIIIQNIETTPQLTINGTIVSINQSSITVVGSNGAVVMYDINGDTEININYQVFGMEALSLIGKDVFISLNPQDLKQAKILRITAKAKTNTIYDGNSIR